MSGKGASADSALVDDELVSCFMWASGEPGKDNGSRQQSEGGSSKRGSRPQQGEYEGGRAAAPGPSHHPASGESSDGRMVDYVKHLEAKVNLLSSRLSTIHSATTGCVPGVGAQQAPHPQRMANPGMINGHKRPGYASGAPTKRHKADAAEAHGGCSSGGEPPSPHEPTGPGSEREPLHEACECAPGPAMSSYERERGPPWPGRCGPGPYGPPHGGHHGGCLPRAASWSTGHGHPGRRGPPPRQDNVASLVERFMDNRRRRQQTIDAHLDEVPRRRLLATPPVRISPDLAAPPVQVEDAISHGNLIKFAFWGCAARAAPRVRHTHQHLGRCLPPARHSSPPAPTLSFHAGLACCQAGPGAAGLAGRRLLGAGEPDD